MDMDQTDSTCKPDAPAQIDNPILAEHATEIRRRGKRVVEDVIEIGRRLTEAKKIAGHGNWLPWLDQEFGWDERTAQRFISVHELAGKSDNLSDLNLPISGLYLLAAPSTSPEASEEIIERAKNGEKVSVEAVKQTIAKTRITSKNAPACEGQVGRGRIGTGISVPIAAQATAGKAAVPKPLPTEPVVREAVAPDEELNLLREFARFVIGRTRVSTDPKDHREWKVLLDRAKQVLGPVQ
jgi:hypothetical protein